MTWIWSRLQRGCCLWVFCFCFEVASLGGVGERGLVEQNSSEMERPWASEACRLISFFCTPETWAALEGCYNICFLSSGYMRKKKARSALSITDFVCSLQKPEKACDSFGVSIVGAHYCNKADLCLSRSVYKENCQWPTAVRCLMRYYKGIKDVGGQGQGYRSTVRKTAGWNVVFELRQINWVLW